MMVEDINAVITGGSSGLGKATAELILQKIFVTLLLHCIFYIIVNSM